jgi:hypothetical protein
MAGVQCQGQGMDTGTKGYRAYFQSVCVCVCVCVCVRVCGSMWLYPLSRSE